VRTPAGAWNGAPGDFIVRGCHLSIARPVVSDQTLRTQAASRTKAASEETLPWCDQESTSCAAEWSPTPGW